MEVVFKFQCRFPEISGDNVGMRVSLADAQGTVLWVSQSIYIWVYSATEYTFEVPESRDARYMTVGVYDLEDALPLTVYRDGEQIAQFTQMIFDEWGEETVELPALPPTPGETIGSLMGAILPIVVLGMMMGMLTTTMRPE